MHSAGDAATPVVDAELDAYFAHLRGALDGPVAARVAVVIDCANGAAYDVGPRALRAAGAMSRYCTRAPDGRNISRRLRSTIRRSPARGVDHEADLGLALDGDADRS